MYDQFYGLQGRPFQLTPDPQFYFESATHRKALSYLGYGLAQGEGFIVITGDIGAGKTTLVGHLMNTIDPVRLTAIKIVSTQVEGDDMLRLAAQGFGIAADGVAKAQLLQRIEHYLHQQARAGRRTLLIVDEAQNLPVSAIEELRMLSNFQLGGQSLLQIFLLGQPEFRDLVKSPELEQLRQRVIATHHLEPMMELEVEPYIVHRLSIVGWTGNPRFTPDAFARIYAATAGVPRRVNALVSRVLLMGAIDQLRRIDGAIVDMVAADMGLDVDQQPSSLASSVLDDVQDNDVLAMEEQMDEATEYSPDPIHSEADEPIIFDTASDPLSATDALMAHDAEQAPLVDEDFWRAPEASEIETGDVVDATEPVADQYVSAHEDADHAVEPALNVSDAEHTHWHADHDQDATDAHAEPDQSLTAPWEADPSIDPMPEQAEVHSDALYAVAAAPDVDAPFAQPQAPSFAEPEGPAATAPEAATQSDDQHLLAAMVDEIVRLRTDINALTGAQDSAYGQSSAQIAALDARFAQIEERLAGLEAGTREQDAALRRVLALLVDWVEREERMASAA